jgi:putative transposase
VLVAPSSVTSTLAASGKNTSCLPTHLEFYASQCKLLTGAKKVLPHLKEPYSQVLQQVLQQLEKAFIGMWEQERGFPRFKKPGRMRSFLFPQFNESPVVREGLQLPKLGWVQMRLHRPIPEGFDIKQVRIVKRASGWYAMLYLNTVQLVIESEV